MGIIRKLISCLLTISLWEGHVSGTLFYRECQETHELQFANNYRNSKIRDKSRKWKFETEETESVVNHLASKVHVLREYLKNNKLSYYSNGTHMPLQEKPLE